MLVRIFFEEGRAMTVATKYHLTAEGDRLPVLRHAVVVWRIGANGEVEIRGIFADEATAKADPAVAVPAVGWKVTTANLVAWNAIALRGA
jgi:hypothetical protein